MKPTFDPVAYLNDPAWFSSRYGLDRMRDLMARLGNPQDRVEYVHVAGTNGKGSTCAYLDSVLRAAGYTVGLYTSPYIETFEERIRVNGANIPLEDLTAITRAVRDAAEAMVMDARAAGDPEPEEAHPTAFELMTAVAFTYFAECECDIVVLEVGLGGLLDATNVIAAPEVAVIARLGIDHTEILGSTLAEVATNKAGIIKPGCTVVSWPQEPEGAEVIFAAAEDAGCELRVADLTQLEMGAVSWAGEMPLRPFAYRNAAYETRLLAAYQPRNAAVALEAVAALQERGWDISPEAVRRGVEACIWPGRFEVIGTEPLRIVDGGHNAQGAVALAETLADVLPQARPVFVLGILRDKDYRTIAKTLAPFGGAFFCVTPPSPRALPASELAEVLRGLVADDVPVEACESFEEAGERAKRAVEELPPATLGEPASIVATGSLYSIAEEKAALR